MLALEEIVWLHAEITSKCNAHCPACARNNNGYGLRDGLILEDLNPIRFKTIIDQLPKLKTLQLCGTYGDPVASAYIDDIIDQAIDRNLEIRIHTNGSLKTANWWKKLADKLVAQNHCVIFGIDGLDQVHEIYRQGTSFKKIIENAASFIDNGGQAEWQFLLFEHNQHQVKECMAFSQQMGFKKFTAKKSVRIPKIAYHYQTKEPYAIKPLSAFAEKFNNDTTQVTKENCMHLNLPSIYVTASGQLTPCCYLHDLEYADNQIDIEIAQGQANQRCQKFCGKATLAHNN